MATEKDLEDAIAAHPELIEDGLTLLARQAVVLGRRIDLLFRDRHGRRLLVELKWGPIKDQHIGQLLSYEGTIISPDDPDLRVMLVGTRVPPSIQRSLDHHGISWKEVSVKEICERLELSGESELSRRFREDNPLTKAFDGKKPPRLAPLGSAKAPLQPKVATPKGGSPALLAIVEAKWLEQALDEFSQGKEVIFFGANSRGVGPGLRMGVQNVYFKISKQEPYEIVAAAKLVGITKENFSDKRLTGSENNSSWKYYYGFGKISRLSAPVALSELRYFSTGNAIRNDVPGACLIKDPFATD